MRPKPAITPTSSDKTSAFSQSPILPAAALLTLALCAHLPGLDNFFVAFDDWKYILNNPYVKQGLSAESAHWAFTTTHASNWHPLTWLSHMLDVELFGMAAWGHHLTGILLHCASVLLLFAALVRTTQAPWRSFLAAALFAVHPVHVESVAWASERKDELSLLFALLSVHAYIAYARRPGFWRYSLVALLLASGLMAKPMLVTLPFALLLLDWWPLGRFRQAPAPPAPFPRQDAWRLALEKAPLLALCAVSSLMTMQAQTRAITSMDELPLLERSVNAVQAYVSYVGKYLYPQDLTFFYGLKQSTLDAGFFLSLAALFLATAMALLALRRLPWLTVGWLWFLGTLTPVIGIIQVGAQSMADRYLYLPGLGLALIAAWSLGALWDAAKSPLARAPLAVVITAVLLLLSFQTREQTRIWQNSKTLGRYGLQLDQGNYMAHMILGWHYFFLEKAPQKSFEHFNEVLKVRPGFAQAVLNAGVALQRQGKFEEAREFFLRQPSQYWKIPDFLLQLAVSCENTGRLDEARQYYQQALELAPGHAFALERLRAMGEKQQGEPGQMAN